jgi:hypothetical protein
MRKIIFILLGLSCTANALLLVRASLSRPERPKPTLSQPAKKAPTDAKFQFLGRVNLDSPEVVAQNLRRAGADDETTRAILDGLLRRRMRVTASERRTEAFRTAWWKPVSSDVARLSSIRLSVTQPLTKLLGPDPLDLIDAAIRYDFLPPEKRALLARIDVDYAELQEPVGRNLLGVPGSQAATNAAAAEDQLLLEERRKDLLAALTPEELAEYELRLGGTAELNVARLARMNLTEGEFRALKPILDERQATQRASRNASPSGERYFADEQQAIDRIVTALGYDRALEYLWGGSAPSPVDGTTAYDRVVSVLKDHNALTGNAPRLFQLGAETGERAAAIHHDASLSPEQKKAALLALQDSIRPQLDTLVPSTAQSKLPEAAIGWFRLLGEGKYERIPPTLFSSARFFNGLRASVTMPASGSPPQVPIPRPQR